MTTEEKNRRISIAFTVVVMFLLLLFVLAFYSRNLVEDEKTILEKLPETGVEFVGETALLTVVNPEISVERDGEIVESDKEAISVIEGDKISTSTEGKGYILFSDASLITLDNGTEIVLEKYSKSNDGIIINIRQVLGRTWSRVEKILGRDPEYTIETSNTVASVRGTVFGCDVKYGITFCYTEDGEVVLELTNLTDVQNEIILEKGQQFENDLEKVKGVETFEELLELIEEHSLELDDFQTMNHCLIGILEEGDCEGIVDPIFEVTPTVTETVLRTLEITPTYTVVPTYTVTPVEPTSTTSIENSPTPTIVTADTQTPVPTNTIIPEHTSIPTITVTPLLTTTVTPTTDQTPIPTETLVPTASPTPIPEPTHTLTPTPTDIPRPETMYIEHVWTEQIESTGMNKVTAISKSNYNDDVSITGATENAGYHNPAINARVIGDNTTDSDVLVGSYLSANGNPLWEKTFGGPNDDEGLGIAHDASGSIYITGYFSSDLIDFSDSGTADPHNIIGTSDCFIAKFFADGTHSWTKTIGSADSSVLCTDIAVDQEGVVYVVGSFNAQSLDVGDQQTSEVLSSIGGWDWMLLAYDGAGSFQWGVSEGGINDEYANALAISEFQDIYVTGGFNSFDYPGLPQNYVTEGIDGFIVKVKTLPSLSIPWRKFFGEIYNDEGLDIDVNVIGDIYIAGYSEDPEGEPNLSNTTFPYYPSALADAIVSKYFVDGTEVWSTIFGGSNYDTGESISSDINGSIYIGGDFDQTLEITYEQSTYVLHSIGYLDGYLSCFLTDGTFVEAISFGGAMNDHNTAITTDLGYGIHTAGSFIDIAYFDLIGDQLFYSIGVQDAYISKYINTNVEPF